MSEVAKKEQLTVRLASDQGEANATAVASTMTAVASLLSEAQQGLDANKKLLIKARPFEKGSFEIPLDLIVLATGAMFATDPLIGNILNVLIDDILDVIKKYFEIKNLLQGDNVEKKDDKTIIIKGDNININSTVLNLLDHQCPANQDMSKALENIEQDETISDIELVRGDEPKPLVKVSRSQFGYYKLNVPSSEFERVVRNVESSETLIISAPQLLGNAKWTFIRDEHAVEVKIADQDFLNRVRKGAEMFRAGDRLVVDIVIRQEFNPTINDYENKSFTIKHVQDHKKNDVQPMLFD